MVDWNSLINPVEGGWQMGGTGVSAGLLAPNSQLYPYLGDIGAGLLAASRPSIAPQGGLGARLGTAMDYAGQRQSDRLMNDTRRMALSQASDQRAAEAKFRELLGQGGDPAAIKAAASTAYPELVAKSLFPATDPETALKILDLTERMEKTSAQAEGQVAQNVGVRVANENFVDASQQAVNAVKWIKTNFPERADAIISSGKETPIMRKLNSWGIGKLLPEELTGAPPEKIPELIDRMEAIQKARKAISIGLANNQQGVVGLQTAGESLGEGAGAAVNLHQFENALRSGRRVAELNKWELPEGITVEEAEASGVDVKGAGKPKSEIPPPPPPPPTLPFATPPGVSGIATPPPPTAQAGAGPAAPAPAAARPRTYRSEAEIQRDFRTGKLVLPPDGTAIEIILNGEPVRIRRQ